MNDALEELGKYMVGVGAVGQAGIGFSPILSELLLI